MNEKARLKLDPEEELRFKGPFSNVVTSHLKLANPSEKIICFKVKTTAPKCYCVRPNSGFIKPREFTDVSVMLQTFNIDSKEKNKHKFMVQSVVAPDGDDLKNIDAIFKSASPDTIVDCKLRCVLEEPSSQDSNVVSSPVAKSAAFPLNTSTPTTASPRSNFETSSTETKLQAEISRLTEDNRRLKEQEIRLKKLALSEATHPSRNTAGGGTQDGNSVLSATSGGGFGSNIPPVLYLMLAFILGLIFGKFLL